MRDVKSLIERASQTAAMLASTGRPDDAPYEVISLGSPFTEGIRQTLTDLVSALDVPAVEPVAIVVSRHADHRPFVEFLTDDLKVGTKLYTTPTPPAGDAVREALDEQPSFMAIVDLIGEFGREVYYLLDDCETSGPVGYETHTITTEGLEKVSDLLDRIEALPFEEPGYILGPGAMLQAALKQTVAALSSLPREPEWRPTHRHVKTGGEYQLCGIGKMQSEKWIEEKWTHDDPQSGNPPKREWSRIDMREVAIYRGADGKMWVRPSEEFEDGRFVPLPNSPVQGEG